MDYFFSVRGRSGDVYSNSLGGAKYLAVTVNVRRANSSHEITRTAYFSAVQDEAGATEFDKGNIVFFVHGFNTDQWDMLERHRKIRGGLKAHGFRGCVVSFDWPSDGSVLGYNADRRDARLAADRLRALVNTTPFALGDGLPAIKVTVSVGLALSGQFSPESTAINGICDQADKALYAAKSAGRDQVAMSKSAA